ncbi:ABC transporter permease [Candidatus Nitrotoga sp. 1052]|uniref:ABC transporter permease n=1 Tax=Candidatus Nitrotoga sp. 1052 TaxID=2886964 RepID=UPI001EF554C7|nr:ABC transporter permease [Candidatus Nitrotoga sp. 1052]CAH1091716.1 ABC transporter family protein YhhJ [Candidatus Nitrotoga sp. 1052]
MRRSLANIFQLGIKELYSLRFDPVMLLLIVYMFTFAVFEEAQNANVDVVNAAVGIVDEDRSQLSRRIGDALLPPRFQPPDALAIDEIDAAMEAARYTFVIDIPPGFQADILAGRPAVVQLNVDATAMGLAGTGAGYIQRIIAQELNAFLQSDGATPAVNIVTRARFNPNLETTWFQGAMSLTNNITLMAMLLTGAALIREREHGTIEHLLVMPLRPVEIMLAKVWANGLVVVIAASLSLFIVVQGALAVPISGSIPLYLSGTVIYLFSVTSLGIYLATLARSMPQFGLLTMIVYVIMLLLSGGNTPLESMPAQLQTIMQLVPSTHFVRLAQAILFRDAGLAVVWPQFVATAAIGALFFLAALLRFRKTVTLMQG